MVVAGAASTNGLKQHMNIVDGASAFAMTRNGIGRHPFRLG